MIGLLGSRVAGMGGDSQSCYMCLSCKQCMKGLSSESLCAVQKRSPYRRGRFLSQSSSSHIGAASEAGGERQLDGRLHPVL